WILAKDDANQARLGNVMAHLVESLRIVGVMLKPFLTEAPAEIFRQLGITDEALHEWDSIYTQGQVQAGTPVEKGTPIFPRLDAEVKAIKDMMEMTAPKQSKKKKQQSNDEKEEVVFDDFMKLDFRVAEITKADKVKKADKLLKLQVDLGKEKRQMVSGIAEFYT